MFHLRDQTKSTWKPNKDRDTENTPIETIDNNVENFLLRKHGSKIKPQRPGKISIKRTCRWIRFNNH